MRPYLVTTGLLFALLAVLEGPGIGLVAAALGLWALRLLRLSTAS
jgi:hypothetical protein